MARTSSWSLLAPLPAAALGFAVAAAHGVRWTAFLPNLAALGLGVLASRAGRRAPRETLAACMPGVGLVLILAALIGPDIDGVHRWLGIGTLRLNVSSALAPWLLYGMSSGRARVRTGAALAAIGAQLVHLAQPDAGQATALAAGTLPLALDRARFTRPVGVPLAVAVSSAAAFAWTIPDPLAAIDHVERILVLGAARGALWSAALVLAGGVLLAPLAARLRSHRSSALGLSAVLYLCASFAVTWLGNFPVPVFGAGAGPVLGWYVLLGLVAGGAPVRPVPSAP